MAALYFAPPGAPVPVARGPGYLATLVFAVVGTLLLGIFPGVALGISGVAALLLR